MKRTFVILAATLLGLAAGVWIGCEEGPRCREACLHACEICGQFCDPSDDVVADDLDVCIEACVTNEAPHSRVDCVLSKDSCEDLWEC